MYLNVSVELNKAEVFQLVKNFLEENQFSIVSSDQSRPWGGFYVIDERQSRKFIDMFFTDVDAAQKQSLGKISPKILIVEGGKRLSWQYHNRRAEVWKVIGGVAGVITSEDDSEGELQEKSPNDVIVLKQGERHRLIGTQGWGIIAEIWQHTDDNHPSDEEDIVRVQDDFGR